MKKLFGFFVCVFLASAAFAGQKTTWQVDVLENGPGPKGATAPQSVATFNYVASITTDGTMRELSTSLIFFEPAEGTTGSLAEIQGHAMLTLLSLKAGTAQVHLEIWDSSRLDPKSPYFKSYVGTVESLTPGQTASVDFTQGDASVKDGSVKYTLNLKLVSVDACQDDGDCQK